MTTELATVNNTAIADYIPSQYSTLDTATKEAKKVALNAINNAESLNAAIQAAPGRTFDVVGIFTAPGVRRARANGQSDSACTNTTLVCADGTAFFTQSEGIRKCADSFYASGLFEDGESVQMQVVEKQLPGGNSLKTLVLV